MIKVHNPNDLPTIDFRELVNLQPESFKDLSEERFTKLSNSFKRHGFFVPYYVWIDNDTHYIVDGHQRTRALSKLQPTGLEVPYVTIQAKTKKEAAEKLLVIDAKYGKRTMEGEQEFIDTFEIEQEYIDDVVVLDFTFIDYSEKNKEIDVNELDKNMVINLNYTEEEYWEVKEKLSKIADTPEQAVWKLLRQWFKSNP